MCLDLVWNAVSDYFFKSVLDCFVSWLSSFNAGSSPEEVIECKKDSFHAL